VRGSSADLAAEGLQRLGRPREVRRLEVLDEALARDRLVEHLPRRGIAALGDVDGRHELHDRLGDDHQLAMPRRHVEVVDDIALGVLVGKDARARRRGELEAQATLHALGTRLHAHLHHALADGRVVPEVGQVVDGVSHGLVSSLPAFVLRPLSFGA
jgi:hypothetical protein